MKSGMDRRLTIQADKCVEREGPKGGERADEAGRLRSHAKLVSLAESLQESSVMTLDDVELESTLRAIHRAKVQLAPDTLVGLWTRNAQQNLSLVTLVTGHDVIEQFISRCCPFDVPNDQVFMCEAPRLGSLVRFIGDKGAANKFTMVVLKKFLVMVVKSVDVEPKVPALLALLAAVEKALLVKPTTN